MAVERRDLRVLRNKRDASRYQILVTIADRQPAVSQQEIAEEVGITAQAVSDYVQDLVEQGFVLKGGRGRYEVTKEGVDWLISRTDDLREYTQFVSEEVIGQVDTETALATADIGEGERVTLTMADGVLHATPETGVGATAIAITSAREGREVGVTDFEGIVDFEPGQVTVLVVPHVRDGGSRSVNVDRLVRLADEHECIAVAGVESLAAARAAKLTPDLRFGTTQGVTEAAARGLSVLLLVTPRGLSAHTDGLREHSIGYELLDERERS